MVLLSCRGKKRLTDWKHKAGGLIRTVAGVVAKLISQRKLGSSPYLLAPESQSPRDPSRWTARYSLLDTDRHDSWVGPSEIWRQMKCPSPPTLQVPGSEFPFCNSHLHSSSGAKWLQVSLKQNHMDIHSETSVPLRRQQRLFFLSFW